MKYLCQVYQEGKALTAPSKNEHGELRRIGHHIFAAAVTTLDAAATKLSWLL